ncbi:DUF3396 domain-containing protein [Desulfovibrio piger]|nr:DUF3396 domain-containing protein [Desulfovibrio piger]
MENIRESLDGFALPAPDGAQDDSITETLGWVGLTCILYFEGGHLPEVQSEVCECIREYVQILEEEARSCLTLTDRLVLAKKKGLPLPDEEQIRKWQEKGHRFASYIVSSNATREDFYIQPPKYMLDVTLQLTSGDSCLPQDKDISYISAGFAPSFFLVNEPPISFAELVLAWCRRLKPVSGAAGWGVTRACDFPASEDVRPFIAPYLLRFPGLNLPETLSTYLFVEHISDINWLTIINEKLAARIGGPERLRALGENIPIIEYPGGYIIQAGPRPEMGDRSKGDISRFYGKVQDLLRPLYPPLEKMLHPEKIVLPPDAAIGYVPSDLDTDIENQEYMQDFPTLWLHRFE